MSEKKEKSYSVDKRFLGAQVGTQGHPLPRMITISEDMPKEWVEWLKKVKHPAIK